MLILFLSVITVAACNRNEFESHNGPAANLEPAPCDPDDGNCGGSGDPSGLFFGDTDCTWDDQDCNMCVSDVPVKFNEIRDHGEVLGFRTNNFNLNIDFSSGDPHLQGIQRLRSGGGRYFVVTKSDSRGSNSETSFVVEMASRDTIGARFRSNRLAPSIHEPERTPPPASDRVIRLNNTPYDSHDHAGGTQALGNVLAMASELKGTNSIRGRVYLYDYRSPTDPQVIGFVEGETVHAGAVALAKLSDGRFLLGIGRYNSDEIEFYRSNGYDLFSNMGWTHLGTKTMTNIVGGWPIPNRPITGGYQTLNFITDCSGALYLVGMYKSIEIVGDDYLDLYRVSNTPRSDLPTIYKVARKQMYCSNAGDRMCNFNAGTGVYVTPEGQILIYAVEHADTGPGGSVNMVEFRSVYPNANCGSDITKSFVEFYDDSDFSGRGFLVDYVDRMLKDETRFENFGRMNDKPSAVRFCMPQGWRVRVYQNTNHTGSYRDLIGTGAPASYSFKNNGFNDRASSMRWAYDPNS